MPGQLRVTFARLVALCALTLGVLAMHHVTTGPLTGSAATAHHGAEHPAQPVPDDPTHAPGHGAFHMCLAVLVAATLTLAIWLLLRTARAQRIRLRLAAGPGQRAGRGPPFAPTTSAFLSTLCILRV